MVRPSYHAPTQTTQKLTHYRVFMIEGILTMGFGILVFIFYPDYPRSERTSKWLTPREQEFVELRLSDNAPLTSDKAFSSQEALATLKDPRLWSFMLTQVCLNIGNFGLSWFLVCGSRGILLRGVNLTWSSRRLLRIWDLWDFRGTYS